MFRIKHIENAVIVLLNSIIILYQKGVSLFLGNRCRFYPSCSQYARESLIEHGIFKGGFLSVKRIGKCHPLHPGG
ncbi:MAG: membrane protein insertion efficiency factor YidD, partial [FCB group bacterium]|nr:membrane protein insertion efficiency factor YidD [FCB group bacterium]